MIESAPTIPSERAILEDIEEVIAKPIAGNSIKLRV